MPNQSYNIIDSGSIKMLYLLARRHQHSDICLNELNKIRIIRTISIYETLHLNNIFENQLIGGPSDPVEYAFLTFCACF